MFGQLTYIVLLCAWALPVLVLQWVFGWRDLWRARRAWLLATVLPALYLCLADRFALGDGIWRIHEDRSTGIEIGGLPLEEALFFLMTSLLVAQSLIFFQSETTRRRVSAVGGLLRRSAQPPHPPTPSPPWGEGESLASGGQGAMPPAPPAGAGGSPARSLAGGSPARGSPARGSPAGAGEGPAGGRGSLAGAGDSPAGADGGLAGGGPAEAGGRTRSLLGVGQRRGTLGAAGGALLSVLCAAVLTAPAALEPVAQVVMQATPVAVANVLLQRLDPLLARSLALFGALALLLMVGGLLGMLAASGPWGRGLALLALGALTLGLAREAALLPALAYAVGQAIPLLWPARPSVPQAATGEGEGSRRAFLRHNLWVAGGAAATLGAAAGDAARRDRLPGLAGTELFPFSPPPARVEGFPVAGQSPEVTPVPQFYVVSKNAQDPLLDARFWRLSIGGLARERLTLSFDELRELPRQDAHVTLQCVSNPVGGSLMSHALWSGASLQELLQRAGPLPAAGRVVFRAPDGHEESVPLEVALLPENMIAYAMNGQLLTRLHGHPARALLPGLYGFKQVKWLSEVRLAPAAHQGYWPRRGWTDEATIRTTARIDLARREGEGVRVAGMALAGRRGISGVEVRLGAGSLGVGASWAPWTAAEAHHPALSDMTWVQWRALLRLPAGAPAGAQLAVEARAVDGEGRPQSPEPSGPYPNGASGYHRMAVKG